MLENLAHLNLQITKSMRHIAVNLSNENINTFLVAVIGDYKIDHIFYPLNYQYILIPYKAYVIDHPPSDLATKRITFFLV